MCRSPTSARSLPSLASRSRGRRPAKSPPRLHMSCVAAATRRISRSATAVTTISSGRHRDRADRLSRAPRDQPRRHADRVHRDMPLRRGRILRHAHRQHQTHAAQAAPDDTHVRSQVIAMIERCPSGSFTYSIEGQVGNIEPDLPKQVAATTEITSNGPIDGPLWVTGSIPIERADGQPFRDAQPRHAVPMRSVGEQAAVRRKSSRLMHQDHQ